MDAITAAGILGCDENELEFHMKLQILTRMHFEHDFMEAVVKNFNPSYVPT